jgi:hypothetical protein
LQNSPEVATSFRRVLNARAACSAPLSRRGARLLPLPQEKFGAAFVAHVDQHAKGDHDYHQYNVDLHCERGQKNRQFGERIACEQWIALECQPLVRLSERDSLLHGHASFRRLHTPSDRCSGAGTGCPIPWSEAAG